MTTPLTLTHGLAVGSAVQADRHARRYDAVLSVTDPGLACRVRAPNGNHLVLRFEDVDTDHPSVAVATESQVAEALAFARQATGTLLVHCQHGVSRSTALAYAVFADRMGPGHEEEALAALLACRPCAVPNALVVVLADQFLNRGGDLVTTLENWVALTPYARETRQRRAAMLATQPGLYARREDHLAQPFPAA